MLILFLLFDVSSQRAEPRQPTEFHSWSSHPAGSWVRYTTVTEAAGQKVQIEQTQTLLHVGPDKAVVETKSRMFVAGNALDMPPSTRELTPNAVFPTGETVVKTTTTTIEIAGRKLRCRLVEWAIEQNGITSTSKAWICTRVPGGVIRMESKCQGAVSSSITLVAAEWGRE